ncbi:MAG: deoxyribonuclease V [Nitrospirota bacterium]
MRWPGTLKDARKVQLSVKHKVQITRLLKSPVFIAGVDAAFSPDSITAAACLYRFPDLVPLEDAYVTLKTVFPYVPGFLSFREGPAIIKAVNRLKTRPDVILFDGQGIAHPHGLGIASHIGVLLNIPAIGCAKSRLVGEYSEPGIYKGQYSTLSYRGHIVGMVVRTRDRVKPVFVSPGHLIDLESAVSIILKCTRSFRIPEPIRRADHLSRKLKKSVQVI